MRLWQSGSVWRPAPHPSTPRRRKLQARTPQRTGAHAAPSQLPRVKRKARSAMRPLLLSVAATAEFRRTPSRQRAPPSPCVLWGLWVICRVFRLRKLTFAKINIPCCPRPRVPRLLRLSPPLQPETRCREQKRERCFWQARSQISEATHCPVGFPPLPAGSLSLGCPPTCPPPPAARASPAP